MISTNYQQVADHRNCDDEEATEAEMQGLGNSLAFAAGVLSTLCLGLVFWIC